MARPSPIVVPVMSSKPGYGELGQNVGQAFGALFGRSLLQQQLQAQQEEMLRQKQVEEEAARQEFITNISPLVTQQIPAAGPPSPEAGPPVQEVENPILRTLARAYSATPELRQKGLETFTKMFTQGAELSPYEQEYQKAAAKLQAEKEFGVVKEGIFGKITDPTKFTPESIRKAEQSGSIADLVPRPEALQGIVAGKDKINAEQDLRKEYVAMSKDFSNIRDSFARIQESSKSPTPAGDLAIIFGYMKMLDPTSVVREGEFATAENSGSIPQRVWGVYNKALSGERLEPSIRKDFVANAQKLFSRQEAQHNKRAKQFTEVANRSGLDTRNVVLDLSDPMFKTETTGGWDIRRLP